MTPEAGLAFDEKTPSRLLIRLRSVEDHVVAGGR
jgi:hypothetical protein